MFTDSEALFFQEKDDGNKMNGKPTTSFRQCIKMLLVLGMEMADERRAEWTGGWDRIREGKGIEDRRGGGGEVVF